MLAVAASSPAFAGAWTAARGASYNKFAFNYFAAESTFGPTTPGFERFENINVSYYGEYGLLDNLTLFGSAAVANLASTVNGQVVENGGLGDVDVGLRLRLLEKPFVLSTQVLFKIPYFYNENNPLPLGNGQEDLEFRVLVGRGLGRLGYFGLEAGYRIRFQAPSDEFRYLIEYGFDVTEKFYLRTKLDGQIATQSTNAVIDLQSGNPQLPLAFNLAKVEATAGYKINKTIAVEFTATPAVFGDNILRGVTYQAALVAAF
ncbi:MAG TPA: hypothetical protein DCZ49_09290 [Hyphomonadaceae bacterium]|jgi:hypothetical protein|nr:hypothetical protein [Hyphomonadaceae bacterium]